jgi:hypothetical protein
VVELERALGTEHVYLDGEPATVRGLGQTCRWVQSWARRRRQVCKGSTG